MGEAVKVFGNWLSPYSHRVIWALKLKSIPFEYVEEDLSNKSSLLLKYNPVYKRIPVLVHGGKPIAESMIILEYLDQMWPQYPLLPLNPYDRATARFWINYVDDKGPSMWKLFRTNREDREMAVKTVLEMLRTVEEEGMGIKGEKKYFGGENIGMVDIAYGGIAHWLGVIEKTVGIQVLEPHKFPKLHSWIQNFKQSPVINENLPDADQMIAFFKRRTGK